MNPKIFTLVTILVAAYCLTAQAQEAGFQKGQQNSANSNVSSSNLNESAYNAKANEVRELIDSICKRHAVESSIWLSVHQNRTPEEQLEELVANLNELKQKFNE